MAYISIGSEVLIAERIARKAHAGQTEESTGDDYIKHVERVVRLVCDDAKPAAWLHDVLEDTEITDKHLRIVGVSYRTLSAVKLVTRNKELETYATYIQKINKSGNSLASRVKIADLRDHLRPGCPARLRPRYEAAWRVLCPTEPIP